LVVSDDLEFTAKICTLVGQVLTADVLDTPLLEGGAQREQEEEQEQLQAQEGIPVGTLEVS
jgi:hypothetical protein